MQFTLFCREICFVAIHALWRGEKLSQKFCLWRKRTNIRYAPRPSPRPSSDDVILSPMEDAIARGHMEVWDLLKDHVEMTVEMKLDQLYNMIVSTSNRDRKKPYTVQFRELLSSVPIDSVTLISKGDPPETRTLLQARLAYSVHAPV